MSIRQSLKRLKKKRHIENLKTEIMEMLDIQSDKKTQINNIKNHIEGIKKRQANIDKEVYQLTLEKDKELQELTEKKKQNK